MSQLTICSWQRGTWTRDRRPHPVCPQVPAGDRVVQAGTEIVYRATSGSGQSKLEIVDHAQRFLEKITFK